MQIFFFFLDWYKFFHKKFTPIQKIQQKKFRFGDLFYFFFLLKLNSTRINLYKQFET